VAFAAVIRMLGVKEFMMRFAVPALILLLAATLGAQDSFTMTERSVRDDRTWLLHFDVTQSGSQVLVSVEVTTPSQSGLRVRMIDPHSRSELIVNQSEETRNLPGTLDIDLLLPARTGTFPVILSVQTLSSGTSFFTPFVEVPAGTLQQVGTQVLTRNATGLARPLSLYATYTSVTDRPVDYTSTVTLERSAITGTFNVGLYGEGSEVEEVRVYNDATNALLATLLAAPNGALSASIQVPIPAGDGEITLRLESQGTGFVGNISWGVWPPAGVTAVGLGGDGAPSSGGGGGGGGGCSNGPAGPGVALLAMLALATLIRRRIALRA